MAFGDQVDRSVGNALIEDEERDGECGEGRWGDGDRTVVQWCASSWVMTEPARMVAHVSH